jgi:hypothetical protein
MNVINTTLKQANMTILIIHSHACDECRSALIATAAWIVNCNNSPCICGRIRSDALEALTECSIGHMLIMDAVISSIDKPHAHAHDEIEGGT